MRTTVCAGMGATQHHGTERRAAGMRRQVQVFRRPAAPATGVLPEHQDSPCGISPLRNIMYWARPCSCAVFRHLLQPSAGSQADDGDAGSGSPVMPADDCARSSQAALSRECGRPRSAGEPVAVNGHTVQAQSPDAGDVPCYWPCCGPLR